MVRFLVGLGLSSNAILFNGGLIVIVCYFGKMGKMIENYSLQNEVGRGMYSTVYRAVNIKTKQEVAIKMVKAEKFKQYPKLEEGTYNEISILTNLQPCPHIIKYFDMLKTVNNFYFVYEYCNGGTLEKLLKERGALPQKTALTFFAQIVEAFRVLNKNNIMHRDLKPQNLLLHDGIIKLADFGFCKPLESEDQISKTMLGSPIYMAPQVLKGEEYSIKADIWSLGVVLFRMLYGFCPFESNNIGKLIMIMEEEDIKFPSEPKISPEVTKLLRRMITKNPVHRADWAEVFSYEVKNGELFRATALRDRTPRSALKKSSTLSETTMTNSSHPSSGSNNLQVPSRRYNQESADIIYNPRQQAYNNNGELRKTYQPKSPFRQNFKKDLMMKNHQKCIQIMSLATSLLTYDYNEALAIAYFIMKNVEKELLNIFQSLKKEQELKNQEPVIRAFLSVVETETAEIKSLILQCRQELREEMEYSVELIEMRKNDILKTLVGKMTLEQKQEDLVTASRVVDYLMEDLVIRKQTYERMSRDKMISNIKSKLQGN